MTLAARHRAKPVILGAIAAFALLNTLAVLFGVAIASWMPDYIVAALVSVLFKTVHSNNVIKLAGFFSTKFDRQ
jgi:putative Ca2+/H+ antiporter (TMEM165/GDT1 family)